VTFDSILFAPAVPLILSIPLFLIFKHKLVLFKRAIYLLYGTSMLCFSNCFALFVHIIDLMNHFLMPIEGYSPFPGVPINGQFLFGYTPPMAVYNPLGVGNVLLYLDLYT